MVPASVRALRQYSAATFWADLAAGVTVGLVALPLAMAFAVSSGMTPQAGIYCAVVTGFLISALGGSNVQIGGPTGAFVVVVSGIIAEHGIDGPRGAGRLSASFPAPVVIGFTNGIALVIASTQIKDLLGIPLPEPIPAEFVPRMQRLLENSAGASSATTAVGVGVLALIIVWNRMAPKVPGYIVALVGGTIAVSAMQLPLDTIGTRFGSIPSGFPVLRLPVFRPDLVLTLLSPTLTVAMLGAIESLMSAVVADRMTGGRHNSNVELDRKSVG